MPSPAAVPRSVSAVVGLVVVVVGLGGRALLPDAVAGPFGDALYATLLVCLVVLVAPSARATAAAAIALLAATAVEVSHLTDLPGALLDRVPAARLVLGSNFGVPDLLWYGAGAALGGALLAATRPRAATVDAALRNVREHPARTRGRWVARVAVPLALVGVVASVGLGVGRVLQTENAGLTARLDVASAELEESVGRVADDAVRSALAATIDDAEAVREATPVLERRPGDADAAAGRLDGAIAAVHDSRRVFATAETDEARATLTAPQRRAVSVLAATDELADDGRDAGGSARGGLRDALGAAEELVAATAPDRLTAVPLAELEGLAASLVERRDAVKTSTTALMVAQDAVSCPEEDQRWYPLGGRLDDDDLAPIPWAPQHRVRADLVDSLVALDEAYRAAFGAHLSVNSGYRSYGDQVAVYDPENPNPLAAPPGCSNHGLGTAVDVSMGPEGFDGARFAWMTQHAEQFGWVHPDWAGPTGRLPEPWHWESVETPTSY